MKKGALLLLVVLILSVALLGGCAEDSDMISIGMTQIIDHPALNAAREGFIDALENEGFIEGENIKFNFQDANNEISAANTIAENFVADGVDMILAISTPSAQAAATITSDIPIMITAVTDPVAAGLVDSLEEPGTNVTGTHDMNPIEEQLELMQELVPGVGVVGVIYDSGEDNSLVQVNILKELADEMGLEVKEASVTGTGEVSQAAESLVGEIDAFYIPTDNTVVSAISSVIQVAEAHDIPIVAGEENTVEQGAVATIGINYYELGYQTGQMAAGVLRGEFEPAATPVESQANYDYVVNITAAENMGVELPQSLLDKARIVE